LRDGRVMFDEKPTQLPDRRVASLYERQAA
jgi:hypothetical protein